MTDCWIGIDVAKDELVVGVRPSTTWTVANDERGIRELRAKLAPLAPDLIVLEATGGYGLAVVAALVESQLPVVVVNPRQVRDFAKATGELAKTEALDALLLARFGDRVRSARSPMTRSRRWMPWCRGAGSSWRCCRRRSQLVGRGKPKTLALVACMRKLLVTLKRDGRAPSPLGGAGRKLAEVPVDAR